MPIKSSEKAKCRKKSKYYIEWTKDNGCYDFDEEFYIADSKADAEEKLEELYVDDRVRTISIKVFKMKEMNYKRSKAKIFE